MMNTMQRKIKQVYEHFDAQCGTGRLMNLTETFQQFTLQTFLQVGVGLDTPFIGESEPSAFKDLEVAIALVVWRQLLLAFVWKLQRLLNVGREKKIKDGAQGDPAFPSCGSASVTLLKQGHNYWRWHLHPEGTTCEFVLLRHGAEPSRVGT
jgi:hypothetical protein